MSRPSLGKGWVSLVLRPGVLRSRLGAGCLGLSRPAHAQPARDMRTLSTRPALAAHTTCARPACCVRSSAHDLGTTHAVCAPPGFWVCALCTKPSSLSGHCLNTVHRVFKKKIYIEVTINASTWYVNFFFRCMNSVSGLCLSLRDTALKFNLPLTYVDG